MLGVLLQRDKMVFSLCHLCVLYTGCLPAFLFAADTHHTVPVQIMNFEPFAVPFNRATELNSHDYKQILRAFKLYFDLYQLPSASAKPSSFPHAAFIEQNLPLYKNLLLFEATHGNHQKALNMLKKLSTVCPHLHELWHTLCRWGGERRERESYCFSLCFVLQDSLSWCH